jgi:hypothetical protein
MITFKNNTFRNNDVAADLDGSVPTTFQGNDFDSNGVGVIVRDPRSLRFFAATGINPDAPPEAVVELMQRSIRAKGDHEALLSDLRGSRLIEALSVTSDLSQLAAVLLSPQVQTLIAALLA